jgi:nucleolar protein 12
VESTRFRSVPFSVPATTDVFKSEDAAAAAQGKSSSPSKKKEAKEEEKEMREHEKKRLKAWQEEVDHGSGENRSGGKEKQFLTPSQKKKIAFIKREFHPSTGARNDEDGDGGEEDDDAGKGLGCNAYIVFAHIAPVPADWKERQGAGDDDDEDVEEEYVHPSSIVRNILSFGGRSVQFMDRTLRLDTASRSSSAAKPDRAKPAAGADGNGGVGYDPKLSIFVGNLDFGTKEVDLRGWVEDVLGRELGSAGKEGELFFSLTGFSCVC